VPVVLRSGEEVPEETTLIVHLGAGALSNLIDKAIGSYDDYREVAGDGFGRFALSVYAAARGHEVAEIVEALPWNQYGTCTVGELRELFELWPTTIIDVYGEPIDPLQEVHFDVIVVGPEEEALREEGVLFDDEDLDSRVRQALDTGVNAFRGLFEPRNRK
jgi:hypothetical protein